MKDDNIALACRLRGYADEPDTSEQKQKDLLTAAARLIAVDVMLNAIAPLNGKDSPVA